jgi:sugar/nucleoside kinase (ribokinase family)
MTAGRGRVVVIGDVIDDIIVVPAGAVRAGTDTSAEIVVEPGGSAANTAAWLGRLGIAVDFHGLVGAGDAERHARELQRHGVRALLGEHPDLPTGRIVVLVDGDERTFLTMGGANRALGADAVTDAHLDGAAALHLTGHSMLTPERLAQAADLIDRARRAGVPAVVDPSSSGFLTDVGPAAFLDAMRGADALLPNLDEARVLTGTDDPAAAAASLTDVVPVAVVTVGPDGAVVAVRGSAPVAVPAVATDRVDPTGAGDAFAAAFHAARVRGADAVGAVEQAVAVASRAVSRRGARPA